MLPQLSCPYQKLKLTQKTGGINGFGLLVPSCLVELSCLATNASIMKGSLSRLLHGCDDIEGSFVRFRLRRASFVAVMKTADLRYLHDSAQLWRLDGSRDRGVLSE